MKGYSRYRREQQRQARLARLRNKLQQIGLVDLMPGILNSFDSWNARFRIVQTLRAK